MGACGKNASSTSLKSSFSSDSDGPKVMKLNGAIVGLGDI